MAWNSCESARSRPRRGLRRRGAVAAHPSPRRSTRANTRYRCGVLDAIGAPRTPDIHAQAGLGAWWNKMLKTKAVAALKGKGKKLMPGEHNKAW
jgi:hypothetical protein